MRVFELLVLLMLGVALGLGVYIMWDGIFAESKVYKPFSANFSGPLEELSDINAADKIVQFYPNMRFKDRSISYRLESACPQTKWATIEKAFEILSERTVLSFYHSADNPEIRVLCSEVSPESKEKGHFIAGEGGPSEIINTTNFAVILNGRISLYKDEMCDEPKIAIHEILHVLGFDHYNNAGSIMYPTMGCNLEIDREIIDDINRLYYLDSFPDLAIDDIEANKTGRYLNFDINISNIGLADSIGARLEVYVGEEKIANFTVGALEIGMKKMLFIQNVKLPRSSESVTFVVKSDDPRELTLENNRAEIS